MAGVSQLPTAGSELDARVHAALHRGSQPPIPAYIQAHMQAGSQPPQWRVRAQEAPTRAVEAERLGTVSTPAPGRPRGRRPPPRSARARSASSARR